MVVEIHERREQGRELSVPEPPHITVVICTRNRSDDLRRCLRSLVLVDYPAWNVVIVDQSSDEDTRQAVESYPCLRPRLHYYHMRERGLSRARNAGLRLARGDVIAFIDDDCTVESEWLRCVAAALARYPQAALIFGAVHGAPHDSATSFIPTFQPASERVMRGRLGYIHTAGIGASMYLRRRTVAGLGRFDVHLGAGARLVSGGEDIDYLHRCLARGHAAAIVPSIVVLHHGARPYGNGAVAQLIKGYAYSSAVTDMKMLRCGNMAALLLIASHGVYCLTRLNLRNLVMRRGPNNSEWVTMYCRGLVASFRFEVDRQRLLYVA